jgi:hypothetical protein
MEENKKIHDGKILVAILNALSKENEIYSFDDMLYTDNFLNKFATNIELIKSKNSSYSNKDYELCGDIYKYEDYFIGISFVSEIYNEMMCLSDIDITLSFTLMKEILVKSYVDVDKEGE